MQLAQLGSRVLHILSEPEFNEQNGYMNSNV